MIDVRLRDFKCMGSISACSAHALFSEQEILKEQQMCMTYEQKIAMIAHQVNKAYCESIGDFSQPHWHDAPDWQRISIVKGVQAHLTNPALTPEESHELWLKEKHDTGWTYGPIKDADAKTHPYFMPYSDLSAEQKAKDIIFKASVSAAAYCFPSED